MKSLIIKPIDKGFSLIEVVVALFILSISVITIYNLIISTAVSSYGIGTNLLQIVNVTNFMNTRFWLDTKVKKNIYTKPKAS